MLKTLECLCLPLGSRTKTGSLPPPFRGSGKFSAVGIQRFPFLISYLVCKGYGSRLFSLPSAFRLPFFMASSIETDTYQ